MKLLNEILGTKYPIIQGGMANIATGEFAAACSNAGALGIIGAGGMNADTLRENIRRCKQLTDKPFGVNIMLMSPYADDVAKVVVEEGIKVVTTGAGIPGKYMGIQDVFVLEILHQPNQFESNFSGRVSTRTSDRYLREPEPRWCKS